MVLWKRKTLWMVFCPLLLAVGVLGIVPRSVFPAYSFLWLPLLLLCGWLTLRFTQLENHQKSAYVLGFAFSFFFALGYRMRFQDGIGGLAGWGLLLAAAAGAAPAVAYGVALLHRCCLRLKQRPALADGSPKKAFWFYAAVLLGCWLPVFLAYYPGLFAYDVMFQIPQVVEGTYRTDSPILHTLWLGAFYLFGGAIGSHTLGMALYTIVQMGFHALILAYAMTSLYRQGCPRAVRTGCLLFFALCPIHSMMSISMTKDVLYSSLLLLALLLLREAWVNSGWLNDTKHKLGLILTVALTCLMRTNGVFVFVLFGAAVCVTGLIRRSAVRRISVLVLAGMLLFGGSSMLLSKSLQAKPSPVKELLSVPLQQASRVYSLHQAELPESDAAQIREFIPGVYAYVETYVDHVKAFANVGMGNIGDFAAFWAKLLVQYPSEYIDAFLFNCQGYWFMDDTSQASHYGVGLEGRQGYLLSDTKQGFGVEHTSYFPALEQLYENLFSANAYQQIPIFSQIFSLALYSWLLGFVIYWALCDRRRDVLLCAGMLLGSLLMLWLGPCAIVRYQYPLMLGVPILLGLLCSPASKEAL